MVRRMHGSEHQPSSVTGQRPRKGLAQTMAEFGLALPILLMVVYGLIESGRLLFIYASVVSAARQAVRYGAVTGDNGAGTPYYNDCTGIRNAAQRLGFIQPFNASDIDISYDTGPGGTVIAANCPIGVTNHPVNGDRIRVSVSTDYSPIVPLVPFEPFTISSSGHRTLLVGVSIDIPQAGIILTPGGGGGALFSKTASPILYDTLGQVITYTYTINNVGTDPIDSITVGDDHTGPADCSGATDPLPVGDMTTCSSTYAITQADIDAGTVTNEAILVAQSAGLPISAIASATITFDARPELTLTKSGVPPATVDVGQQISYTFTLQNTGNVQLSAPYAINDPLIGANWDCTTGQITPLPVGASTVCTGFYVLKNTDINRGYVDNTATATARYGAATVTSNPASTRVLVPEVLLTVVADAPPDPPESVSAAGEIITYTYNFTNRTTRTIDNIVINPTRGTGGTCLASLGPGASSSCTRTYTVTQADMDGGIVLINQVTATAQGNPSINQASVSVGVLQAPTLHLTKLAEPVPDTVPPATVTYTYEIENTGNVTLNSPYSVADDRIALVDCSGAIGSMLPGEEKMCTASYTVDSDDLDAGSIINHATASAMWGTQTITSAEASATVITYAGARLGLEKSASPTYFTTTGQVLSYTFTLKNTGGVPLNAPYSVTDSLIPVVDCSGASPTIPVGGSTTCTGSYSIGLGDNIAGSVTNSATATSDGGTVSSTPSPTTHTTNKFVCTNARVKHADPTPIPSGTNVNWVIINNSGAPLNITSATISWGSVPPQLMQLQLGGTTIWSSPSSTNGGFVVPGGPWSLPTGNTTMQLGFSAPATGIRVVITVSGPGCDLTVDSDVVYPS